MEGLKERRHSLGGYANAGVDDLALQQDIGFANNLLYVQCDTALTCELDRAAFPVSRPCITSIQHTYFEIKLDRTCAIRSLSPCTYMS